MLLLLLKLQTGGLPSRLCLFLFELPADHYEFVSMFGDLRVVEELLAEVRLGVDGSGGVVEVGLGIF